MVHNETRGDWIFRAFVLHLKIIIVKCMPLQQSVHSLVQPLLPDKFLGAAVELTAYLKGALLLYGLQLTF